MVNWLRKRLWRLEHFFNGFLEGDLGWGTARLFIIVVVHLIFILVGILVEYYFIHNAEPATLQDLYALEAGSADAFQIWSKAFLRGLRYLLIPLIGFGLAFMVGAHYIQDIYELESYTVGFRYLLASLFGIGYPRLEISEGKKNLRKGETNTLNMIGGPGYIQIRPGNTVLFERLTHPANVLSAGWYFIPRFESVKEIIDLRDQHGHVEKINAMTKDGLLVNVFDIHFIFRLAGSRREGGITGRTPQNPYPFSVQAVHQMAYNRSMGQDGLSSWHSTVQKVVEGEIQDYIRGNQVDVVTAPPTAESDPRREIRKRLISPRVRNRLQKLGADLIWFDIGHIAVDNLEVEEQRISTWGAEWVGDAQVIRSYGEAQRTAFQELGRAEAQAEMIISILSSWDEKSIPEENKPQVMRNLFLIRTAQIVETLSLVYEPERPKLDEPHD